MSWRRLFRHATRSLLGLTPENDRLAASLLRLPLKTARERVKSMGVSALLAERERVARRERAKDGAASTSDIRPPTEVRPSLVPGGGSGLFMRRDVAAANPGDIIALYAGVYFPPAPPVVPGADGTSIIVPEPKLVDGGQYVIHLQDGGHLDGAEQAREAKRAASRGECAGWAVASLANHPPKGFEPNVEAIQVDWESTDWEDSESIDSMAQRLVNPKISGTWYVDGATGVHVSVPKTLPTRGLVFLANRRIAPGEEIYFNYRLHPSKAPDWFTPVPNMVAWREIEQAEKDAEERAKREEEHSESKRWNERTSA